MRARIWIMCIALVFSDCGLSKTSEGHENPRVLKVSDRALYWREIAKFTAPYATIGSFILSGLSFNSEKKQEERFTEISRKLDEIRSLIVQGRQYIEKKLNDTSLRERTGEVLGIDEALNEYRKLLQEDILTQLIVSSAKTKQTIRTFIVAGDTPLEYRVSYCALYFSLIPLRVATFRLYQSSRQIKELIKEELNDLIAMERIALDSAKIVGENRVSTMQTSLLGCEPGVGCSLDLYIYVDGKSIHLDNVVRGQDRRRANKMRDRFVAEKVAEVMQPFRKALDEARNLLDTLSD